MAALNVCQSRGLDGNVDGIGRCIFDLLDRSEDMSALSKTLLPHRNGYVCCCRASQSYRNKSAMEQVDGIFYPDRQTP